MSTVHPVEPWHSREAAAVLEWAGVSADLGLSTADATAKLASVGHNDIEAEKAVLSAILLDNEAIHAVVTEVRDEDFYHPSHQML